MNRKSIKGILVVLGIFIIWDSALMTALAQKKPTPENLDAKVEKFLKENQSNWQDWNVPFDFIFSDADKEWYPQYFKDLEGKLVKGGCFTAHNVDQPFGGIKEFLDYIQGLPNYLTTIHGPGGAGISISYKK